MNEILKELRLVLAEDFDFPTTSSVEKSITTISKVLNDMSELQYEEFRKTFAGAMDIIKEYEIKFVPALGKILADKCQEFKSINEISWDYDYIEFNKNTDEIISIFKNHMPTKETYIFNDPIINMNEYDAKSNFDKLISFINFQLHSNIIEKNIEQILFILHIIFNLGLHLNQKNIAYELILSCLEKINKVNGQIARDACESIAYGSEKNNDLAYGYMILFSIYEGSQKRIESLIYGILCMNLFMKNESIHDFFKFTILITCVVSLRNINMNDEAYDIGRNIKSEILKNPYQRNQLYATLFSCKIEKYEVISEIKNYLDKYIDSINEIECECWISLILNIMHLHNTNDENLNGYIKILKKSKSENYIESIRSKIGLSINMKKGFIDTLNKIQQARYRDDISNDLKTISPHIQRATKLALEEKDIDLCLLSHYANSIPFSVENAHTPKFINLNKQDNFDFCAHYLESINKITAHENESLFIFILVNEEYMSAVTYLDDKRSIFLNIGLYNQFVKWSKDKLDSIGSVNYTPGKMLSEIPKLKNFITSACTSITIVPTKDIVSFPMNLLKSKNGLISEIIPIRTVFPSYFTKTKKEKYELSQTVIKFFDKNDKLTSDTITEIITLKLATPISPAPFYDKKYSDIQFFIGHGAHEQGAFSEVASDLGRIYRNNIDIFSSCKVAIFFVCHAGVCSTKIFSNDINSLAAYLINSGVEHVIAPAWSLPARNVTIWIESFLLEMNLHNDISRSVHAANIKLKQKGEYIDSWPCMNLFSG